MTSATIRPAGPERLAGPPRASRPPVARALLVLALVGRLPPLVTVPQGNPRDVQLNGYAVPVLQREALSAGSADIDNVSEATHTSEGATGSLQSALDRAGA